MEGDKTYLYNLYVGQVFKNYKVICEFLNEDVKSGRSKQLQIINWGRYFSYDKEGQKFIITNIYKTPSPKKIDGRTMKRKSSIYDENYNIDIKDDKSIGVYKIQLHNQVYIGSTIAGFRQRYIQHLRNKDGYMPHTQKMIKSGASFEILWKSENNETEEQIRRMEQKYLDEYKSRGYEIKNGNENVIIPGQKKSKKKKIIRVMEDDYNKVLKILTDNGIKIA